MALLSKLKSILGIGGSRDGEERTETAVTVEQESDDETATTDDAVDAGTDGSASMTETDSPETETATEAAGSPTETVDDEPRNRDVEKGVAESDEEDDLAVDDQQDVEESPNTDGIEDTEAAEKANVDETVDRATEESEPESADTAAADDDSTADSDLTAIKGIGPAYSERLNAAGISSVAALADADAETVGEEINVSPKTVSNWIDRAADQ